MVLPTRRSMNHLPPLRGSFPFLQRKLGIFSVLTLWIVGWIAKWCTPTTPYLLVDHIARQKEETVIPKQNLEQWQRQAIQKLLLDSPHAYKQFPRNGKGDDNDMNPSWCVPGGEVFPNSAAATANTSSGVQGLLFAKTLKTASSTAAAVTMRVARRVAQRGQNSSTNKTTTTTTATTTTLLSPTPCQHMFVHTQSFANLFAQRDEAHSFLWTIVRHPYKRAISSYKYFELGSLGQPPSKDAFVAYLEATKDQMVLQLRMDRTKINEVLGILVKKGPKSQRSKYSRRQMLGKVERHDLDPGKMATLISETVQRHNFVAVSERMDESLVVLLFLLGLLGEDDNHNSGLLTDLVVLPSKQAGGWEENGWAGRPELHRAVAHQGLPVALTYNANISNEPCIVIPKHIPNWDDNDIEKSYLDDNLDALLYDYANRNLDHTIDTVIGRERVQKWVVMFQGLQAKAEDQCQETAVFPCSSTGRLQESRSRSNCYNADMGCGYQCIDRLFPISGSNV